MSSREVVEKQIMSAHGNKGYLPAYILRKDVAFYTAGACSAKHLANLDSLGLGPSVRITINNKVAYEIEAFITWLVERTQIRKRIGEV